MNAQTQKLTLQGGAGAIEALLDEPQGTPLGVAVLAHPHPLFGGTMNNKVVQTLARACVLSGWRAVRFNFRGVGESEGTYDEGRAETEDMLAVIEQVAPAQSSNAPLVLGGFSFGSFVTSHVVARLAASRELASLVLVGTAASRFDVASIAPQVHPRTLVIHGEQDDTVPLTDVMNWARPQSLPVTVIPGVEHFFHGQLPLLRSLVVRHLQACMAASQVPLS